MYYIKNKIRKIYIIKNKIRITMDSIDKKILKMLQVDAKVSRAAIAERVGIVPSAVHERIRKLEQKKIINSYETRIQPKSVDLGMASFVWVDSDEQVGATVIGKKISELPEVQEVHFMAGGTNYLIKVRVRDTDAHTRFVEKLGEIKEITSVRTVLVLKTLKESLALDIQ